ncbi:helix-turn-helix domain-containing protein [Streptosporangium sp. NBC_01810]|uniref:helix-turn-helix domain-containing protein n=1 Tax=Streptosporangium sp. NBC_01810 TaxID=2975951 RepID=UPI002DD7F5AF|nr:helix-turn-helix transcriptional regulator [Streptosporangium sp. NBC_01810]WSA23778.1 helix-turn-helix domain-containing protein [Streptosporangium sp. NBC_01810]
MPPTSTVRQNGPALRAFREARGLSVADLAKRAEVTAPALRNWELENKALPVVKAARLCRVLSISMSAIDRDAQTENSATAEVSVT